MFGSSVFLCLGVCLVLFGIFGYLISVKLTEQNEKIKNMVDLIYTITNDLQLLKLQQNQQPPPSTTSITTQTTTQQLDNSQSSINSINHNFIDKLHTDLSCQISTVGISTTEIKKIVVSDCENYSSDEDEDDESDDADDDDDDDDESDTDNVVEYDDVIDNVDSISSYISENAPYNQQKDVPDHVVEQPITVNLADSDFTTINLDLEDMSSFNKSTDLLIDETSSNSEKSNNKLLGLSTESSVENTKTIILDLTNDNPDYNRMSIKELRKMAIERKLIDASSKAKKSEILKLL
jgi:hypothetical protein